MTTPDTKRKTAGDLKGRFSSDLTGTLKTVNVSEWGIRGIITTTADEQFIYVITYDKIDKSSIPILSKGDSVSLSRVYISDYYGKVTKWQGLEQAKLCKNGQLHLLRKAEPTSETPSNANGSKAITSSIQAFENLQVKIKEARTSLQPIEKLVSMQDSKVIDTREFIRASIQASLHYQRLLAAILTVLEREE